MGYNTIENPQLLCQCSGYCPLEGGGGLLAHGVACRKGNTIYPPQEPQVAIPPEFAALGIASGESVMIPRAQYDALMGAAKSLVHLRGHGNYRPSTDQAIWVADNAIAALRAAGILEEGEK